MKKTIAITAALTLSLALAACGNNSSTETKNENKTETVADKTKGNAQDSVSFKNDTLTINQGVVKLKKSEVVESYDKKQLAITFDYTNNSDEAVEPSTVFIACFNLSQENDTSVADLTTGFGLDEVDGYSDNAKNANLSIKPGKTVEASIAYELVDENSDVTLTATQGVSGDKLGTKVYKLK